MPTYEYRCPACGNEFEKFQRMSEDPVAECTACGQPAERKLSAGAGLLFKGSGFYITDYRNDSYKQAAKSDAGRSDGAKSDAAKNGSSGGDSKPSSTGTSGKSE